MAGGHSGKGRKVRTGGAWWERSRRRESQGSQRQPPNPPATASRREARRPRAAGTQGLDLTLSLARGSAVSGPQQGLGRGAGGMVCYLRWNALGVKG